MDTPKKRGRPKGSKNKFHGPEAAAITAEQKLQKAMPKIVDFMIEQAMIGDKKVARYLMDRAMGKPTERHEVTTTGEQVIQIVEVDDWRSQ